MKRIACLPGLFFALTASAEGVVPVDPGLWSVSTKIESEAVDQGTGTLLDSWTEPYEGAACLAGETDRRIYPGTFIDTRCQVSNVRADPYGEAFDLVCTFPEGLLSGTGTLAVDRTRPTEFRERLTLRGTGTVALQRITITGTRVGACLAP